MSTLSGVEKQRTSSYLCNRVANLSRRLWSLFAHLEGGAAGAGDCLLNRVYVPPDLRPAILEWGHRRTLALIQQHLWWSSMGADVRVCHQPVLLCPCQVLSSHLGRPCTTSTCAFHSPAQTTLLVHHMVSLRVLSPTGILSSPHRCGNSSAKRWGPRSASYPVSTPRPMVRRSGQTRI